MGSPVGFPGAPGAGRGGDTEEEEGLEVEQIVMRELLEEMAGEKSLSVAGLVGNEESVDAGLLG